MQLILATVFMYGSWKYACVKGLLRESTMLMVINKAGFLGTLQSYGGQIPLDICNKKTLNRARNGLMFPHFVFI